MKLLNITLNAGRIICPGHVVTFGTEQYTIDRIVQVLHDMDGTVKLQVEVTKVENVLGGIIQ